MTVDGGRRVGSDTMRLVRNFLVPKIDDAPKTFLFHLVS